MVISTSTQLGLLFDTSKELQVAFLKIMLASHENSLAGLQNVIKKVQSSEENLDENEKAQEILNNWFLEENLDPDMQGELIGRISRTIGEEKLIDGANSKFFLITQGVLKPAEMIRLNENFSASLFNKVKPGKYTYLLGKNAMLRFMRKDNVIKGFYYCDNKNIGFEFGFDLDTGEYYAPKSHRAEFSQMVQIMTFVELGDIEVIMLNSNQHNGKPKKDGKVMNSSRYSVYVVDSTWNQILVRTDGFAVRGHFKMQPCGPGNKDRKLIWVDAFEKTGYTRRPKAEIVN